jgi:hypothetical protein
VAVDGADPVGQAAQAAALARVGPADAVVDDLDDEQVPVAGDADADLGRPGVLGRVGQGLGDHEVGGRLDRPGQPPGGHLDPDRNRRAGGQGGDGRVQAPVGEHGRVDAAGQVAQLGQGPLGLLVGLADQGGGRGRVGLQLGPGHAQVHGQGDQPLLGAVVQVTLDAAALGLGPLHGPVAAGLEGLDPGPQLAVAGPEQGQGERALGGGHGPDRPGGGHDQDGPGHRGQEGLGQGVDHQVAALAVDQQGEPALGRGPVPQGRGEQAEGEGPQGGGDHEPDQPEREQQDQVGEVLPGGRVAGQDPGPPPQGPGGQGPVGLGDLDAEHEPHPAPLQPGSAPPGEQGQGQDQDPDPDDQQAEAQAQAGDQDDEPRQADEHAGQQVDRGRPGAEPERRGQHRPDPPASRRPRRRRLLDRHRPLLGVASILPGRG